MSASEPFLTDTPPDAIPDVHRVKVFIEGKTFLIDQPADSDLLLDHPVIREANKQDDYSPYWADIWPASRMMAKVLVKEPWEAWRKRFSQPLEALEIGCGLGLSGIVALSCGLKVIFSDYDRTAVEFAGKNARLNGFPDFKLLPMDWRHPPEDLKVPLLLASDVMYEIRNVEPILKLIQKVLLPEGCCFLTDQDRTPASLLRERLGQMGFRYTTEPIRAGEPGGNRVKGTFYRIQKKNG